MLCTYSAANVSSGSVASKLRWGGKLRMRLQVVTFSLPCAKNYDHQFEKVTEENLANIISVVTHGGRSHCGLVTGLLNAARQVARLLLTGVRHRNKSVGNGSIDQLGDLLRVTLKYAHGSPQYQHQYCHHYIHNRISTTIKYKMKKC